LVYVLPSWQYIKLGLYQAKKPMAVPPPSSAPKKAPAVAPSKPGAKSAAPITAGSLDAVKYKHTSEEAESLAADLLPGSIMTELGDANWKTRLAGLDGMMSWLETEIQALDAEVVVRALAKKGWGEKNFQVRFSRQLSNTVDHQSLLGFGEIVRNFSIAY
jgi:cytoskeleton-associated protein 5